MIITAAIRNTRPIHNFQFGCVVNTQVHHSCIQAKMDWPVKTEALPVTIGGNVNTPILTYVLTTYQEGMLVHSITSKKKKAKMPLNFLFLAFYTLVK